MILTGVAALVHVLGRAHLYGASESPAPDVPLTCSLVIACLARLAAYPRPESGDFAPARN